MDDKTLGQMMEYALAHGLGDLEVRIEIGMVMGGKRLKIMAVEGQPDMIEAAVTGFTGKWNTMIVELQKVLDDQNKVATTQATADKS